MVEAVARLAERANDDIPFVKLTGLVMGVALVWAAIRAMFGRGGR